MASKFIILVCFGVAVNGGIIADHGSSSYGHEDLSNYDFGHGDHNAVDYHSHPRYEFSYDVQDDHTGDVKSQQESRDGDSVRGSYTVMDPDGHKRTVEYTADAHEGFKAVVRREKVSGYDGAYANLGGHHQAIDASAYQSGYDGNQEYDAHQIYDGNHGIEAQQQSYDTHSSYH